MIHSFGDASLQRYFSGLAESKFLTELGVADPGLIDYLSEMLGRFLRTDDMYRLRGSAGKRLDEVGAMVSETLRLPAEGRTAREFHRHIGDFTLFWTGVFPESLERKRTGFCKDAFVDYCSHGKRSYFIASTFADEPFQEEARVLRRLSEQFELCAYGLNQVRHEWEQRA